MSDVAPSFDDFTPDDRCPNAATPDVEADLHFVGIRISAPDRVRAGGDAFLPVAGAYQVPFDALGLRGRFGEHVHLVVTGSVEAPSVVPLLREVPDMPPAPESAYPELTIVEYLNVDVGERLGGFGPGVIFIYAVLGPWVSNVVRIDVVDPEASP